jgi:hypothetical protein
VDDLVDPVQLTVVDDEHPAPHLGRRDHHGLNSSHRRARRATAEKDGEI